MRAALLCKPPPKILHPRSSICSLGVQRGCSHGSCVSAMVGASVVAVALVGPQCAGGPVHPQ